MSKKFDFNLITTKYLKFYKNGFTLIELLVVISIIGVLSAIGMASFGLVSRNGRDAKRLADLRIIQGALEQYYADQGNYPVDDVMNPLLIGGSSFTSPADPDPNKVKTYYNKLPKDPSAGSNYSYKSSAGRTDHDHEPCDNVMEKCITYCLYATMENPDNDSNESNDIGSNLCSFSPAGTTFALTPP